MQDVTALGEPSRKQPWTKTEFGAVRFTDPELYQAAVRPAQVEIVVTAKGDFDAALRGIQLPRLWLQRGRENLARVANATVRPDRLALFFLTGEESGTNTPQRQGLGVRRNRCIRLGLDASPSDRRSVSLGDVLDRAG